MKRLKIQGKIVRIKTKYYKQLLGRFDPDKAELRGQEYVIKIPCICDGYEACNGCPFRRFENSRTTGCIQLLHGIDLLPVHASLSPKAIDWWEREDAKARKEIDAIRQFLIDVCEPDLLGDLPGKEAQ